MAGFHTIWVSQSLQAYYAWVNWPKCGVHLEWETKKRGWSECKFRVYCTVYLNYSPLIGYLKSWRFLCKYTCIAAYKHTSYIINVRVYCRVISWGLQNSSNNHILGPFGHAHFWFQWGIRQVLAHSQRSASRAHQEAWEYKLNSICVHLLYL